MNKKLFKLGALTLALIATVVGFNATNAQEVTGDVTLTINTGTATCEYLTSLYLGAQDIKLDSGYTFTGAFTGSMGGYPDGTWNCTDKVGIASGWYMAVKVGDLDNGKNNVISGSHVLLSTELAVLTGTSSCQAPTRTDAIFNNSTGILLISRDDTTSGSGDYNICSISIPKVSLKVNVDANQAPGTYQGTFTVTLSAELD